MHHSKLRPGSNRVGSPGQKLPGRVTGQTSWPGSISDTHGRDAASETEGFFSVQFYTKVQL